MPELKVPAWLPAWEFKSRGFLDELLCPPSVHLLPTPQHTHTMEKVQSFFF